MKLTEAQTILGKIVDGELVTPEQRHGAGKFWKQQFNSFCTQTETVSDQLITFTKFYFTGMADREEWLYELSHVGLVAKERGKLARSMMSKAFPQHRSAWETIDHRFQRINKEIREVIKELDSRSLAA